MVVKRSDPNANSKIRRTIANSSIRLPNWAITILLILSVVVVVGASAGCWISWPVRSARDFLDLVAEEKYDQAQARFRWNPAWPNQTYVLFARDHRVDPANFHCEPRTLLDVAVGRQRFRYGRSTVFQFTVERGKVVESGYNR